MRIPFDSLTLAAVTDELQEFVDGKVQKIVQPDDRTVCLALYKAGREAMILLSCDAVFARAHFVTRRPAGVSPPPGFCAALRARVDGARLVSARQTDFDRILTLELAREGQTHRLVAELMGKHSNLILIEPSGRIVSAAKIVPRSKSSRPVVGGMPYSPPPFAPKPSLLQANPGEDLAKFQGASPFLLKLIETMGPHGLAAIHSAVRDRAYRPHLYPGSGAYPIALDALGLEGVSRSSTSIALEQHYSLAIPSAEAESLRSSLESQLRRVVLAREVALQDLDLVRDTARRAGDLQMKGELILAWGFGITQGDTELSAVDYEGKQVKIRLDPELDRLGNAQAYFDKAKRAKARSGFVEEQSARLESDLADLLQTLREVSEAPDLTTLRALQERARGRHWLHSQPAPVARKEDRPYEGHRIREILAPGGFTVLYGENAESNDYLTLRVAKPSDYWLHVRGSVSAHVVVQTHGHPEKVGRETLMFAAKIAVQQSPSKHAGYVPVDYTLKRYVRRPRGAPKGTALYTHEKTLHIDS